MVSSRSFVGQLALSFTPDRAGVLLLLLGFGLILQVYP